MNALRKVATKAPVAAQGTLNYLKPRVEIFWRYAKVELTPPSLDAVGKAPKQLQEMYTNTIVKGSWKQMTVKDATKNILVGVDIAIFFCIGEMIGKGSIVGYNIPGTTDYSFSL